MTTKTNQENQKPNGQHDLGQITSKANPKAKKVWAVVEFSGTDRESEVAEFDTMREAFRFVERNYTDDECFADVMKRDGAGFLTTEF